MTDVHHPHDVESPRKRIGAERPTTVDHAPTWPATPRIEHHRLRWQITDPNDPLGERTSNLRLRRHAAALRDEIRREADQLYHPAPVRTRSLGISRAR